MVPPEFSNDLLKYHLSLSVSQELLEDSQIPDLDLFLSDPAEYRRLHPYVPPTCTQQLKTWIGAKREKLGEKLYRLVAGIPFPDDSW